MDLMDSSLLQLIRARRAELEAAAAVERDDEEAQRLEGSFIDFVEAAWPALDPAEYQPNWAVDALCEHLQAAVNGDIRHLLVNFPPRCGKTLVTSVCFPAWVWAQSKKTFFKGPQVRFLCGSYNHDLSLTNSNSTRRLILSPWYQSLWGQHLVPRGSLPMLGPTRLKAMAAQPHHVSHRRSDRAAPSGTSNPRRRPPLS